MTPFFLMYAPKRKSAIENPEPTGDDRKNLNGHFDAAESDP
jgi:hypothetical protein